MSAPFSSRLWLLVGLSCLLFVNIGKSFATEDGEVPLPEAPSSRTCDPLPNIRCNPARYCEPDEVILVSELCKTSGTGKLFPETVQCPTRGESFVTIHYKGKGTSAPCTDSETVQLRIIVCERPFTLECTLDEYTCVPGSPPFDFRLPCNVYTMYPYSTAPEFIPDGTLTANGQPTGTSTIECPAVVGDSVIVSLEGSEEFGFPGCTATENVRLTAVDQPTCNFPFTIVCASETVSCAPGENINNLFCYPEFLSVAPQLLPLITIEFSVNGQPIVDGQPTGNVSCPEASGNVLVEATGTGIFAGCTASRNVSVIVSPRSCSYPFLLSCSAREECPAGGSLTLSPYCMLSSEPGLTVEGFIEVNGLPITSAEVLCPEVEGSTVTVTAEATGTGLFQGCFSISQVELIAVSRACNQGFNVSCSSSSFTCSEGGNFTDLQASCSLTSSASTVGIEGDITVRGQPLDTPLACPAAGVTETLTLVGTGAGAFAGCVAVYDVQLTGTGPHELPVDEPQPI